MTLYAENYCSAYGVTINDIATLSFPTVFKTNITQNTSTLYSVSLTWTPTADQVGSQILCAVAIDRYKCAFEGVRASVTKFFSSVKMFSRINIV